MKYVDTKNFMSTQTNWKESNYYPCDIFANRSAADISKVISKNTSLEGGIWYKLFSWFYRKARGNTSGKSQGTQGVFTEEQNPTKVCKELLGWDFSCENRVITVRIQNKATWPAYKSADALISIASVRVFTLAEAPMHPILQSIDLLEDTWLHWQLCFAPMIHCLVGSVCSATE